MAQKLDANLNVIQETPIELELINGDLSIISKLDDEPNDVGGLTSTQLKAKFDEAGNIIKEYLNESLVPAVLAADATEATRSAAEAERVENELERVANENVRVPAETARIAAENIRIENEATRVASEEERIDAEATRKANEAQRIANENAREDLETGYVARAEAAAKRAEDAAADAENTVGGDYVTQEEMDAAIGAIPTPDVYTKTETLTNDTKGLFGLGSGAVPNDAFGVLSKATLVQSVPKFTKHTVANPAYGKSVGDTVSLKVGGVATDFIVVHKGKPSDLYDDSCNGCWLVMKDIYNLSKWTTNSYGNDYAKSTAHTYLNGTFLGLLDADISYQIKQAKIPYINGTGYAGSLASGANGLSTKVFLLSAYEIGLTDSSITAFREDGAKLDYFLAGDTENGANRAKRIANYQGSATGWWLRSPYDGHAALVHFINNVGGCQNATDNQATYGIRPALILPLDQEGAYYTDDSGNIYGEQEYTTVITNVLGEKISVGTQIATGSYKGTGTYGKSNPNSLTFDFEPKLVIITRGSTDDADGVYSAYSSTDNAMLLMKYAVIRWNDSSNVLGYDVNVKFDGNTVSWYTKQSNAECQANASSTSTACYHYFALG